MAEDAAQEERLGDLRHPIARRYRDSAIAAALIESCPTRIFLPNERAIEPQITAIYRRFGLNDRQIEIISRATPKRDYYCQSRRGNRLFELGLGEVALALTAASSKSDQAAIADRSRHRRPREFRSGLAGGQGRRLGRRSSPNIFLGGHRMIRIRSIAAIALIACMLTVTPGAAQLTVFDPSNYARIC